ncbi:protein stoned-A [Drosophila yakuba]|uniref:Protein stoned-A n=1 Tax=Drosophila yakuba TaxID=7245 RepID=B4PZM6_DROYA|nr:protein stoned-A [Drosophila yakuba]XP_039226407.1 protein stoned-A [Drosophila yakuba]XP_039226410.1 protein stoned-A [Drosophila yakuba]EDX03154.1 uncharacterized protein Dyak_GE15256 [Drosophila yakuba]
MLKLPKGLKKKKKKSKKDQELFTEEELEQYKRDLKAKQEAAATKSDAGESDGAASDVEAHYEPVASKSVLGSGSSSSNAHQQVSDQNQGAAGGDEEWAKFKALTSGVDSILHKTQDELDRIKKESFYQRLPSAAEKKKQEEEEAARLEAEQQERERRRLVQIEAQRDKLAEAVVQLSESEEEAGDYEADDIFATDYIEAITSGELQLAVLPDSPVLADDGPDPFDTAYAEKVIVGAERAKGNKKLLSLGAAVEVLSGRVDREHAVALANPKRKLRKGIQNLLLSESVELADSEADLLTATSNAEPQHNLLDDLDEELPESSVPIDLSVSLHLHLIKHKQPDEKKNEFEQQDQESQLLNPDLSEFDALKDDEDDEFAELAAESLTKKEEITIVSQVVLPVAQLPTEAFGEGSWAEFEEQPDQESGKPKRPPPPVRPPTGPHIVPGAIYVSDDEEENPEDDPFNTNYAEQVIKKTTVLEEDDDFDPRAEEPATGPSFLAAPQRDLLAGSATDLSQVVPAPLAPTLSVDQEAEDFDPFDTSAVSDLVQPKSTELRFLERELLNDPSGDGGTLKHSLSDPDFDPRADQEEPAKPQVKFEQIQTDFDTSRRKSSLSLNIQAKSVGFLVPAPDLLGAGNELGSGKKPLTPYYAPSDNLLQEREREVEDVDPFDTSYVPEAKLSDIELKHIEKDLISEPTNLRHSLSDPDFDPRAPPTPVPAEVLLAVEENIDIKVLTPAQERKKLNKLGGSGKSEEEIDPFDTSIAANLQPGQTELKLLENELLPETKTSVTDVLDVQSDAQELGLGDKVLTPSTHSRPSLSAQDIDPFDTSIAENLGPGEAEIKLLESELIER